MASSLNVVALVGNCTRDPELRSTPLGTSVANLRIAVNDRVKRGGEWTDAAYYFDIIVWGNQAEACAQYLRKGSKVGVQGKLTWSEWESKQDGSKRQKVEIVAQSVQFLTPRSEQGGGGYSDAGYSPGENEFVPAGARGDSGENDFGTPTTSTDGGDFEGDSDIPF